MKGLVVLALALTTQRLAAQADSIRSDSQRIRFLTEHRCSDCHAISALNIAGVAQIGPDLSSAYANVPARYGMTLERFLDQPVGLMKGLLSGNALAPATRDSLVTLLRDLYNKQLARTDSLHRAASPPAPAQSKPR